MSAKEAIHVLRLDPTSAEDVFAARITDLSNFLNKGSLLQIETLNGDSPSGVCYVLFRIALAASPA